MSKNQTVLTGNIFFYAFQPRSVRDFDRSGKTALHYCAENENLNCIDQILSAEPKLLNQQDEEGYTPLHLSVISGNRTIVRYLVARGADVDAVDGERHSAVHWATGKSVPSRAAPSRSSSADSELPRCQPPRRRPFR